MPDVIQRIPFHDDIIEVVTDETTGKIYIVPKPLVEFFGLSWAGQHAKLTQNKLFSRGIKKSFIPSLSGHQETLLLERRLVHAWLLSISVDRVKPAYQQKLLRYQEECAEVLDTYFMTKISGVTQASALDHYPELQAIVQMVQATAEARLIAEQAQATAIEAQLQAARAEGRAEHAEAVAQEAVAATHRMTIEVFILGNQLLPQFPGKLDAAGRRTWPIETRRLKDYCQSYGWEIVPLPVVGKAWPTENGYPVQALAWLCRHPIKETQLALVKQTQEQPS